MNVLVTGGTGFIGRPFVDTLVARGDHVTVISRDPTRARRPGISTRGWLPELDGFDAVVHLQGEPIFGKRWNEEQKRAIRDSRVKSTRQLVDAIGRADPRPRVLVSGSAIGYYGDRGDESLPESAPPGDDFMADVCKEWEAEAFRARESGVRVACVRTGIVLGEGGGALKQMLPPFKLGVGGPIGSGRQYMSWIHRADEVGLLGWAIDDERADGPINATAPGAVTNKAFTKTLGKVLHRPTVLPVPPFMLKLALGGVAAVLTASQRCVPQAATDGGFEFRFPEIEAALRDILEG